MEVGNHWKVTLYNLKSYLGVGNLGCTFVCLQEEKNEAKASEAKEVKLYAQIPSIEKMDASLSTLAACEKLSLSTNQIEKIANLNGLSKFLHLTLCHAVFQASIFMNHIKLIIHDILEKNN